MHYLILALNAAAFARYPLIGIGVFIEGPVVMIMAGFLLRQKLLQLVPLFLVIVICDLLADCMWYGIGRFFATTLFMRKPKRFGVAIEKFESLKKMFLNNQNKILFISKLTLGFGLAKGVLMAAGASRVSFKKFIWISFLGEVVLVMGLLMVGYFFGEVYLRVHEHLRPWFIIGIVGMVIFILVAAAHYARRVMPKT